MRIVGRGDVGEGGGAGGGDSGGVLMGQPCGLIVKVSVLFYFLLLFKRESEIGEKVLDKVKKVIKSSFEKFIRTPCYSSCHSIRRVF